MKKDVIILSSIDWDFLWQRHQVLSVLFAEAGWNVVYVDGTGLSNPSPSEIFRIIFRKYLGLSSYKNPMPDGIKRVKKPILPPTNPLFLKLNRGFFLKNLIKRIKNAVENSPILIAYLPTHTTLEIIHSIQPSLTIYDCVSNFEAYPGAPGDIKETEKKLIEMSDFITTDSVYLFNKMKQYKEEVYRIPPGVDFKIFSRADKGPIREVKNICYYGGIHSRSTDITLLLTLPKLLKHMKFTIIGKIKTGLKKSDFPENVEIHPYTSPENLVKKIRNVDAFILPYKKNLFTAGVIPSKTYELLATGKPIIASGLEENLQSLNDVIYFAKTADEFVKIINRLPELETREIYEKRKRIARENSWNNRFQILLNLIETHLNSPQS